ncbi:MAG: efflux RND transporter periplasmic adaptor subunit [Solirubrobacterales bacterium]
MRRSPKCEVSSFKRPDSPLHASRFTLHVLLCLLYLLSSCSRSPTDAEKKGGTAPAGPPAVPVTVQAAEEKTMPVQLQAVGRVLAYAVVSVESRVDGLITAVHFEDGQHVKTGDPLFTLDSAPFEAQLRQAQANLAKDQAQFENAQRQLQRNESVVQKGYVSQEQYDQAVASANALAATVKADQAAVESAALQVQYCRINSPITGRAGAVQVDVGNLIKANDTAHPLVVINQVQPIYVSFYIPETSLPEVRKHMASGTLPVQATVPGHEDVPAGGQLTFLNNTVNTTSGTVQLRATFANEDLWLWPGQFTQVVLTLTSQPGAVVVPSRALSTGQKGQYVFVVKPDLTVEYRPVTAGQTVDDEIVIAEGLQAGENVVTDGQLRLSDGSHVRVVEGVAAGGDQVP